MNNKTLKIYNKVLSARSDHDIKFSDFYNLMLELGFTIRNSGSSHFNCNHSCGAFMSIQPTHDNKAKGYQVKDLRNYIKQFGL